MHKNKTLRQGVSLVLSFFLAVSFFVLSAGILIKSAYLPGNAWKSYLHGSSYGSDMAETASRKLMLLLEERGISSETIEETVSEQALYTEYSCCMDDIWEKRETSRRKKFEEKLNSQLMEYLREQQVFVTTQMESEVEKLVKEAGGIYDSYLNPRWLSSMAEVADKWGWRLNIAILTAAVTGSILALVLWFLYHYKHRAVRYICYSAISSLVWTILLHLFIGRMDWLEQSGIEPAEYRQMILELGRNGMRSGLLVIGAEFLMLLLLLLWMKRLKHRVR